MHFPSPFPWISVFVLFYFNNQRNSIKLIKILKESCISLRYDVKFEFIKGYIFTLLCLTPVSYTKFVISVQCYVKPVLYFVLFLFVIVVSVFHWFFLSSLFVHSCLFVFFIFLCYPLINHPSKLHWCSSKLSISMFWTNIGI